ncbi:MAG: thioredoxin domain-containing protein [Opitutaceae bacterium]|nr:thioredoxin domain-containing protein [Cytophagales bacterium]
MSNNKLISETSPYLLQHAHNPVDWYPWGEEALAKAKQEDKPIILSIGYSACHWCHVMERESFEDENVAEQMNKSFICIKVDREERPDIDQIYMDAVHAMGLQGGWPLNVVLTPAGKPFYGGTYFPKSRWIELLFNIDVAFKENRDKIEESAEGFGLSLNRSELEKYGLSIDSEKLDDQHYDQMFEHLAKSFDYNLGGNNKAPKFPMPCVWMFLLRYHALTGNKVALSHLHLTLKKMALGGIYDQIGGGFARYSTDIEWFAPHFEKMLYDNGQLVSLYSEAYQLTGEQLYKDIVYQTIEFLARELTSQESGFYSALDADSEGEEGKFYVWKYPEIENLDIPQKEWFLKYYNIQPHGTWEFETNIPYRDYTSIEFCEKFQIDHQTFLLWEKTWKELLLKERENRIRPGLDDKILTSWNGLMLNGLIDAYRVFDEERFLNLAIKNASFIETKLHHKGLLKHSYKNGVAKLDGFLEDYASIIMAFTNLYQAVFDEKWLKLSNELIETCLTNFWDEKENLFFFTSAESEKLIARKKEIFDNVIPSSNSMMAQNLIVLGHILSNEKYVETGNKMVAMVQSLLAKEPYYLANWASVSMLVHKPVFEIAICGNEFQQFRKALDNQHILNKVFVGTNTNSELELLEDRGTINGQTAIYICKDKTCQLPVLSVAQALRLLI